MYPGTYNQQSFIDMTTFQEYCPEVDISAYSQSVFSGICNRACQWIYNACETPTFLNSVIVGEEGQAAINPSGDLVIFTLVRPIQSVQRVRLVKGGFSTTLTISGVTGSGQPQLFYQVPWPANKIVYPSSYLAGQGTLMIGGSQQLVSLRGARTDAVIDYTAGWNTNSTGLPINFDGSVKSDLLEAVTLVIRGMLVNRYNQMGADSIHQGNVSLTLGKEPIFYEMAMEILDNGGYHRTAPRY